MALGRVAFAALAAGLENNPARRALLVAENERLRARVALLEELMRIKDARMELIAAGKRPHYRPEARLGILTLRAAAGWSVLQTAREFLLTPKTVAAWMHSNRCTKPICVT